MTRLTTGLFLAAAVLCLSAGAASAQPYPYNVPRYGVGYTPGLSPYLNLLRGGDPAANYYLGVIPEFQRRQNATVFQSELLKLDQRITQETAELGLADPIGSTGHVTAFGNTGGYFGSLTGRQAAAPRPTTPTGPGRPRQ
jgi:hypothetical protein